MALLAFRAEAELLEVAAHLCLIHAQLPALGSVALEIFHRCLALSYAKRRRHHAASHLENGPGRLGSWWLLDVDTFVCMLPLITRRSLLAWHLTLHEEMNNYSWASRAQFFHFVDLLDFLS